MTLVRMVSLTISDEVVRWASPGCKEWAEGLEREASVIENDWAALRWALGSTRVLLDRRPVSLTSLDEVPAATQKLVETARSWAGSIVAFSIMYGFLNMLEFFHARRTLGRAGCALVVLGSIIAGTYSLMERRRLKEPWKHDIYDDLVACASFYKEQLGSVSTIPGFIFLFGFVCRWATQCMTTTCSGYGFLQVYSCSFFQRCTKGNKTTCGGSRRSMRCSRRGNTGLNYSPSRITAVP